MTLVLKSLAEEEADCRARCADMKVGDLILHCHHDVLCEVLTEPVENRINYILKSKNDNPALRFRLMGPPIIDAAVKARAELSKARAELSKAEVELSKAYAELNKAYASHYARLYPDSPWNGKTIFAGEFSLAVRHIMTCKTSATTNQ